MAIPPRLKTEIDELKGALAFEISEDAEYVFLILKEFPLGNGFNVPTSDLLLKIPKSYPDTGPDMFWTAPNVAFADGRIPQGAESIEQILGKDWRRFSWHRQPWNPIVDNMHNHIEFIRFRLRKNE
jgi:hypothetical protein